MSATMIGRPFDFRREGGVGSSDAVMLGDAARRGGSAEVPDNAIIVKKIVTGTSAPVDCPSLNCPDALGL